MTLQNGLIYKRRAYLWTDSAVTDPATGEVVGTAMKAIIGLGWPWAAIHSGELLADDPARVARLIGEKRPRTEAGLIEACRSAVSQEAADGRICRLLVAYADRQDGARMFFMGSDVTAAGPAFTANPTVQHACAPASDQWTNRFLADDFTLDDMRGFIASQVEQPCPSSYGFPVTFGGNLIEVRVTAKGVRPNLQKAIEVADFA